MYFSALTLALLCRINDTVLAGQLFGGFTMLERNVRGKTNKHTTLVIQEIIYNFQV